MKPVGIASVDNIRLHVRPGLIVLSSFFCVLLLQEARSKLGAVCERERKRESGRREEKREIERKKKKKAKKINK